MTRLALTINSHNIKIRSVLHGSITLEFDVTPEEAIELGIWSEATAFETGGTFQPATLTFKVITNGDNHS